MTEQKYDQLKKLREDFKFITDLRRKLIVQEGFSMDNPAIKILDSRQWHLVFRIYKLRKGEVAAAKLLTEIRGIHQR